MTDFLVRKFVKNYEQTDQAEVRAAYGLMAGVVGICCNLLLDRKSTRLNSSH